MNTNTITALPGESRNVSRIGSSPAMYVPTTGRNWLTSPTQIANGIGAWIPAAWNTIQWKNADSSARRAREYR